MKIGIIDADLIGRKKHRFPNLASMKISAYHKNAGDSVSLLLDYDTISNFDRVYLSKAFTDTYVPEDVILMENVLYGGTGFFYDKAPPLPMEIEHSKPDYHLYDEWVNSQIQSGISRRNFTYYLDYSIGFLTRGCFRRCSFCVNQNLSQCVQHSPVYEFLDESRPKLCFLDDNFFACPKWKEIIADVKKTGKRFQFKQGLDERLLTDEKIDALMGWNYDGDYIFAFDNIADKDMIENKLQCIRAKYPDTKKHFKFYVLCGFDRNGKWDDAFWINDIRDTFERIRILMRYGAIPYIMRYEKCYVSPYHGIYSCLAGWCNQPNIFKKFTFREYCMCKGMGDKRYSIYKRDTASYLHDGWHKGAAWRYMEGFEQANKELAAAYFDMAA